MTTGEKSRWAATFPVHVGVDTGTTFHKLVAAGSDRERLAAHKVLVTPADTATGDHLLGSGLITRTRPERAKTDAAGLHEHGAQVRPRRTSPRNAQLPARSSPPPRPS